MSVYLLTYNAGGKKPRFEVELPELFLIGKLSVDETEVNLPDIYIFCLQEVCPLKTKSVITKSDNAQIGENYFLKEINSFAKKKIGTAQV